MKNPSLLGCPCRRGAFAACRAPAKKRPCFLATLILPGLWLLLAIIAAQPARATVYTWNSALSTGTADWNTSADWNPATAVPGGAGGASSDTAVFAPGAGTTYNADANVSTSVSLTNITFSGSSYTVSASSGKSITLQNNSSISSTFGTVTGTDTISANLILAGNTNSVGGPTSSSGNNGVIILSGDISQTASAAVLGVNYGTLVLSGSNSFTGGVATNHSGVSLDINSAYALGSGTLSLVTGNGTTIGNNSGNAITVSNPMNLGSSSGTGFNGGFAGPNNLTFNGIVTLNSNSQVVPVKSGTLTFASGVAQIGATPLGLTVNSTTLGGGAGTAGTLVLGGTSTYQGTTFDSGGTLIVTGSISGGGWVDVGFASNGLATIGGSGLISGSTTVAQYGTLNPGAGSTATANLTIDGTTTFSGGSTFKVDIDSINNTADSLTIAGINANLALTAGDHLTFALVNGSSLDNLAAGTYVLADVTGGGSLSGTFATDATKQSNWSIVYTGTEVDLVVTAIPEPRTWGMILSGAGVLIAFRRSRKRQTGI